MSTESVGSWRPEGLRGVDMWRRDCSGGLNESKAGYDSQTMTTLYMEQFGCRATQADDAASERQLRERGFATASESTCADVVIVNTCTVTAAADAQAREAIRKLHARNPAARVIATGCYAQTAPEELASLPGVSWVRGNPHKPEIPCLLGAMVSRTSGESAAACVPAGAT